MALPRQVEEALAAADRTLAELNAPPPENAEGGSETTTQEASPNEPEGSQQLVEAQTEAAPAPQPTSDWEQKYKVLQGKYNSEVPELHRRVHSLETNLQQAIDRLNEASKAKEQKPEVSEPLADPKDVEQFGEDIVDMVVKVANRVVGKTARAFEAKADELTRLVQSMQETLSGTTKTVAVTAEQTFFDKLTGLVPDWEAINQDPAFLQWLAVEDPVYGVPRQNALTLARQNLDFVRAAAVFNAFKPQRQPEPSRAAASVEKQVSPKGGASAPKTAPEPNVITQAQVNKFYNDVARGQYRGREQEAAQIEQMINSALAEGRIM